MMKLPSRMRASNVRPPVTCLSPRAPLTSRHARVLPTLVLLGFVMLFMQTRPIAMAQEAAARTERTERTERAERAETDAAVTATARELAVDGVKLAQNDQCSEAVTKLERAERLHHSAIVLTRLGECYVKLGRLVEGRERLRTVLRETLPGNPSPALQQAYTDAQAALEATEATVAHLTIMVEGVEKGAHLSLNIDDKTLPGELVGVSQPCDPGDHVVQVKADGYSAASREVTLTPGDDQSITLALVAAPRVADSVRARKSTFAEAAASQVDLESPSGSRKHAADGPNHLPAYLAWGVGGAALGVGVAFGVVAMSNTSNLDRRCPDKSCSVTNKPLLDATKDYALISTIGYAAAGAGAVLGLVLFLVENGSSSSESATSKHAAHNSHGLRVHASADGTGVSFQF